MSSSFEIFQQMARRKLDYCDNTPLMVLIKEQVERESDCWQLTVGNLLSCLSTHGLDGTTDYWPQTCDDSESYLCFCLNLKSEFLKDYLSKETFLTIKKPKANSSEKQIKKTIQAR